MDGPYGQPVTTLYRSSLLGSSCIDEHREQKHGPPHFSRKHGPLQFYGVESYSPEESKKGLAALPYYSKAHRIVGATPLKYRA
jgi:hypothetical protein